MALNAMQLTSRDMARARAMLRDQSKGEDPYELLDADDDPENFDKRRVLIIWCLRSRTDPDFTWDMAWDVPFAEVYGTDDEDEAEAGEVGEGSDPTPEVAPSPARNGNAGSRKKPRAADPEPS